MPAMQPPRGTYDALPELCERLRFVEQTALGVFQSYGYGEIRTPMFEFTEIFSRNVGETTDVVTKEMYTFDDRNGESLTLRPEGTAPVVRAYYSNGLKQRLPLKLCYIGTPMFRYERPQKGRYRQHHQVGLECFGIASPWADVEVMGIGVALLKALGVVDGVYVQLNTLGSPADRQVYRDKLVEYFTPYKDELSDEAKQRLAKNPLRLLDTKNPREIELAEGAPQAKDFLSDESKAFFETVQQGLEALNIPYEINPRLVRGLDYYTHTVFEIHDSNLGAQSQVISGGRYDGLMAQMGGDDVPGVGFGAGLERLESIMQTVPQATAPIAFVMQTEAALPEALKLAQKLREAGLVVHVPLQGGSMKSQFKRADKLAAAHTIILGEEELQDATFTLKNMADGSQQRLKDVDVVAALTGNMHA